MNNKSLTKTLTVLIPTLALSTVNAQDIEIPDPAPAQDPAVIAAKKAAVAKAEQEAKLAAQKAAEEVARAAVKKANAAQVAADEAQKQVAALVAIAKQKQELADQEMAIADASAAVAQNAGSKLTVADYAKEVEVKPEPVVVEDKVKDVAKTETTETAPAEAANGEAAEPTSVKIPEVMTSHEVKPGSSLSLISQKAYSRPGYWRVLKLHNGIAPEKLQAGQTIKAPDLVWLLADCNFTKTYPIVSADLMKARSMFMGVETKMKEGITNDTIAPAGEDKKKIREAIALIEKCREALGKRKEGVRSVPNAAIMQLRTASRTMETIARGTNQAASKQNLVHEHLSNSIVYTVLWARNDFK